MSDTSIRLAALEGGESALIAGESVEQGATNVLTDMVGAEQAAQKADETAEVSLAARVTALEARCAAIEAGAASLAANTLDVGPLSASALLRRRTRPSPYQRVKRALRAARAVF